MNMKYIIEHLDKRLYKWCFLEYKHASKVVGKENIVFTNVSGEKAREKLRKFSKVSKKSVSDIDKITRVNKTDDKKKVRICVLDPSAKKQLITSDKNKFDYLIFGGIMGDYPPQGRTKSLSKSLKENSVAFDIRNLGKEQMSTDTAVLVAKMIIKDGKKFSDIKFQDTIIIEINDCEEVELPFRYVVEDFVDKKGNKKQRLILPNGLVDFLKKRKSF